MTIQNELNGIEIEGRKTVSGWIQTYTGKQFYPLNPNPADIDIEDIAHALSMQCRFTGHTRTFYSVAQHCVYVSRYCAMEDALWGLLHDGAEAYIQDMARPVKHDPSMHKYREVEKVIQEAIAVRYKLPMPEPKSVIEADNLILAIEARDLMAPLIKGWASVLDRINGCNLQIKEGWDPMRAKYFFMERFRELRAMQR